MDKSPIEQIIEAANPNGATLAEIYANIRDKALEEAALEAEGRGLEWAWADDHERRGEEAVFNNVASRIRALKSKP